MPERIKIYKWWNAQLRIYLEGEFLPKWTEIVKISGARKEAMHYSQDRGGKIVPLYLVAAELVVPESELKQVKRILSIQRIKLFPNPELFEKHADSKHKIQIKGGMAMPRGKYPRKKGKGTRGRTRKRTETLIGMGTKELSPNKGVDVLMRFTVAISDVKLTVAANTQTRRMGRLKRTKEDQATS